ncbi:MAG: patatin-like phospholipase family protein [Deltaproteobacteria bacterium]|jgi:NTE family protein|nr:patatin-like phospholipase family protein [Deltaproteobacteria bacterium]
MVPRKTVGLVLGCGSSRGWAHIGAIEALEEAHIPIDFIVGCSVGAYVGAIYASGSIQSLKKFVLKMDGKKVFSYFDIVLPRSGILDGTKRLRELFSIHTDVRDFSELKIPVIMVATDLETGQKVVLRSGNILDALRASISIPGLFAPARIKDRWLVDGGLVDPVPVSVARSMGADVIIAVDLSSGNISKIKRIKHRSQKEPVTGAHEEKRSELIKKLSVYYESAELSFKSKINELFKKEAGMPDIMETVTTSINIMQNRITRVNLAVTPPDVLIQPHLGDLKMLDFDQVEHTIEEGYVRAKKKIDEIKTLLHSESFEIN